MRAKSVAKKRDEDDRDMVAVQNGDGDVLFRIMKRWRDPMRKFYACMTPVIGSLEWDDFMQELSMRIWVRAASYRVGNGTFCSWIHCLARSIIIDAHRRDKLRVVSLPECYDVQDYRLSVVDDEASLVADSVRSYLSDRCGEDRGVAFGWLLLEECSVGECADMLGMAYTTVLWWRSILLKELRNRQDSLIRCSARCV